LYMGIITSDGLLSFETIAIIQEVTDKVANPVEEAGEHFAFKISFS
jgi:hypothetical protein